MVPHVFEDEVCDNHQDVEMDDPCSKHEVLQESATKNTEDVSFAVPI